jgi:hypothetical protein
MDFREIGCEDGNLASIDSVEHLNFHYQSGFLNTICCIFIYKKTVTMNYVLL